MYEATNDAIVPLLVTEVAGTWKAATTVTLPSGASTGTNEAAFMRDVDCVSVGNCVAIGKYLDISNNPHDFALTQVSGGAWTTRKLPSGILSAQNGLPESLSCRSTSNCTMVGYEVANDNVVGVAWTETSGTWSSPAAFGSAAPGIVPQAVACPDATTCIAVGNTGGDGLPAYAIETSGTWAAARTLSLPALSPRAISGELYSISCDTAAVCEAVGQFGGAGAALPQVAGAATWSGGSWS